MLRACKRILCGAICSLLIINTTQTAISDYSYIERRRMNTGKEGSPAAFIASLVQDVFELHKNLISLNTLYVALGTVPLVLATRCIDDKIHNCFYDRSCHKNKNQLPDWVRELARFINMPTIAILALYGFLGNDQEQCLTAQTMLLGLPFVLYVNQVIKKLDCNISLRPWNEHFCKEKRTSGGFPSGHVAKGTYLTVLYGVRFGYKFAIPLSILTTFIALTFTVTNRHYFSQIVAGAGLGAAYGLAATMLIDKKLSEDFSCGLTVNDWGGPALQLSYRF